MVKETLGNTHTHTTDLDREIKRGLHTQGHKDSVRDTQTDM